MLTSREKFLRRQQRSRTKLRKTAEGKVRLSVARSGKNISAQIIDDEKGITLAAASTLEADVRKGLKSTRPPSKRLKKSVRTVAERAEESRY